jgi:paraquat-inducible protein A
MPASLQRTIALLITACFLYVPANVFNILRTEGVEGSMEKTIVGSIIMFMDQGSYVLALIVFTASIIVPTGKIAALSWLCVCAITPRWSQPLSNTRLYRLTELFGRWSMIDVFVVAILSSLVQLDGLMSITPGAAVMAFAGVVIATMLATMSFDTRLIWDQWEKNNER